MIPPLVCSKCGLGLRQDSAGQLTCPACDDLTRRKPSPWSTGLAMFLFLLPCAIAFLGGNLWRHNSNGFTGFLVVLAGVCSLAASWLASASLRSSPGWRVLTALGLAVLAFVINVGVIFFAGCAATMGR